MSKASQRMWMGLAAMALIAGLAPGCATGRDSGYSRSDFASHGTVRSGYGAASVNEMAGGTGAGIGGGTGGAGSAPVPWR